MSISTVETNNGKPSVALALEQSGQLVSTDSEERLNAFVIINRFIRQILPHIAEWAPSSPLRLLAPEVDFTIAAGKSKELEIALEAFIQEGKSKGLNTPGYEIQKDRITIFFDDDLLRNIQGTLTISPIVRIEDLEAYETQINALTNDYDRLLDSVANDSPKRVINKLKLPYEAEDIAYISFHGDTPVTIKPQQFLEHLHEKYDHCGQFNVGYSPDQTEIVVIADRIVSRYTIHTQERLKNEDEVSRIEAMITNPSEGLRESFNHTIAETIKKRREAIIHSKQSMITLKILAITKEMEKLPKDAKVIQECQEKITQLRVEHDAVSVSFSEILSILQSTGREILSTVYVITNPLAHEADILSLLDFTDQHPGATSQQQTRYVESLKKNASSIHQAFVSSVQQHLKHEFIQEARIRLTRDFTDDEKSLLESLVPEDMIFVSQKSEPGNILARALHGFSKKTAETPSLISTLDCLTIQAEAVCEFLVPDVTEELAYQEYLRREKMIEILPRLRQYEQSYARAKGVVSKNIEILLEMIEKSGYPKITELQMLFAQTDHVELALNPKGKTAQTIFEILDRILEVREKFKKDASIKLTDDQVAFIQDFMIRMGKEVLLPDATLQRPKKSRPLFVHLLEKRAKNPHTLDLTLCQSITAQAIADTKAQDEEIAKARAIGTLLTSEQMKVITNAEQAKKESIRVYTNKIATELEDTLTEVRRRGDVFLNDAHASSEYQNRLQQFASPLAIAQVVTTIMKNRHIGEIASVQEAYDATVQTFEAICVGKTIDLGWKSE